MSNGSDNLPEGHRRLLNFLENAPKRVSRIGSEIKDYKKNIYPIRNKTNYPFVKISTMGTASFVKWEVLSNYIKFVYGEIIGPSTWEKIISKTRLQDPEPDFTEEELDACDRAVTSYALPIIVNKNIRSVVLDLEAIQPWYDDHPFSSASAKSDVGGSSASSSGDVGGSSASSSGDVGGSSASSSGDVGGSGNQSVSELNERPPTRFTHTEDPSSIGIMRKNLKRPTNKYEFLLPRLYQLLDWKEPMDLRFGPSAFILLKTIHILRGDSTQIDPQQLTQPLDSLLKYEIFGDENKIPDLFKNLLRFYRMKQQNSPNVFLSDIENALPENTLAKEFKNKVFQSQKKQILEFFERVRRLSCFQIIIPFIDFWSGEKLIFWEKLQNLYLFLIDHSSKKIHEPFDVLKSQDPAIILQKYPNLNKYYLPSTCSEKSKRKWILNIVKTIPHLSFIEPFGKTFWGEFQINALIQSLQDIKDIFNLLDKKIRPNLLNLCTKISSSDIIALKKYFCIKPVSSPGDIDILADASAPDISNYLFSILKWFYNYLLDKISSTTPIPREILNPSHSTNSKFPSKPSNEKLSPMKSNPLIQSKISNQSSETKKTSPTISNVSSSPVNNSNTLHDNDEIDFILNEMAFCLFHYPCIPFSLEVQLFRPFLSQEEPNQHLFYLKKLIDNLSAIINKEIKVDILLDHLPKIISPNQTHPDKNGLQILLLHILNSLGYTSVPEPYQQKITVKVSAWDFFEASNILTDKIHNELKSFYDSTSNHNLPNHHDDLPYLISFLTNLDLRPFFRQSSNDTSLKMSSMFITPHKSNRPRYLNRLLSISIRKMSDRCKSQFELYYKSHEIPSIKMSFLSLWSLLVNLWNFEDDELKSYKKFLDDHKAPKNIPRPPEKKSGQEKKRISTFILPILALSSVGRLGMSSYYGYLKTQEAKYVISPPSQQDISPQSNYYTLVHTTLMGLDPESYDPRLHFKLSKYKRLSKMDNYLRDFLLNYIDNWKIILYLLETFRHQIIHRNIDPEQKIIFKIWCWVDFLTSISLMLHNQHQSESKETFGVFIVKIVYNFLGLWKRVVNPPLEDQDTPQVSISSSSKKNSRPSSSTIKFDSGIIPDENGFPLLPKEDPGYFYALPYLCG